MKKILSTLFLLPLMQTGALAASEEGIQKIEMVLEYCGAMPESMVIGFALLAVLAAITVIILKKNGDDSK